ncbi:MAG: hypothetical protein ACFFCS_11810 [Candidatus Hodarchaeota archaeon]
MMVINLDMFAIRNNGEITCSMLDPLKQFLAIYLFATPQNP